MKTMQYDIGLTFGIEAAKGQLITGYEPGSQYVPVAEANYRFDKGVLRDLMVWWNMNLAGVNKDGMYLFGPTGAGKSAALVNFCALLNIPMYEKTIYEGMEFDVLMGRTEIVGGDTVFMYGVVPLAMGAENEPGILVLNEIDRADDAVLTGLYEVLAGRPLVLDAAGHHVVKADDAFCFAATGNTNMAGASDDYSNANKQDLAFVDRFWKVSVGYPEKEVEVGILKSVVPDLSDELCEKMVDVANDIRNLHTEGENRIPLTMSTRTLLRWGNMTKAYHGFSRAIEDSPIAYALDRALLNVADRPTRAAIIEVAELHIGDAWTSVSAQAATGNGGKSFND